MAYFWQNKKGAWYFRIDMGRNPATKKRIQKSKSGFKYKKDALDYITKITCVLLNNT